ncbi:MAG: hypothetical protein AAF456_15640 [Planctomycetota bacterium]
MLAVIRVAFNWMFSGTKPLLKWKLAAGLAVLAAGLLTPQSACSQIRHDPDNENIERAARRVVTWLESQGVGGRGRDEACLAALVVNEVSKRYDRIVAEDHPIVANAIEQVLASMGDGSGNYQNVASTYYPALACILLCDVDDRKYAEQIRELLDFLYSRQLDHGGFCYRGERPEVGDVSQAQYVGLCYFVARHHGFNVELSSAQRLLEWVVYAQNQGTWFYHSVGGQLPPRRSNRQIIEDELTLSRHCSGLGTMYLLADLLQLAPRNKAIGARGGENMGLPPSVSVYVRPPDGEADMEATEGPLVRFPAMSQMAQGKRAGNNWLKNQWEIAPEDWVYYYLYALERYAFFRELQDGTVREIPDWYDQGVDFLLPIQNGDGSFPEGHEPALTQYIGTCLATLFLVRSSEVLILPSNASTLGGNRGFIENERIVVRNGRLTPAGTVKSLDDVLKLLDQDGSDEEKELIIESMRDSIREFSREVRSQGEKTAFLTGLIKERNYYRRLIAVQILAAEQDMDNVIPLLYALGDPDLNICREAHDGLRLISRKIDSISVPVNATRADFDRVKQEWTDWFLQIRPDAKLID